MMLCVVVQYKLKCIQNRHDGHNFLKSWILPLHAYTCQYIQYIDISLKDQFVMVDHVGELLVEKCFVKTTQGHEW